MSNRYTKKFKVTYSVSGTASCEVLANSAEEAKSKVRSGDIVPDYEDVDIKDRGLTACKAVVINKKVDLGKPYTREHHGSSIVWTADDYNSFKLTKDCLTGEIGNWREGGSPWGGALTLEDVIAGKADKYIGMFVYTDVEATIAEIKAEAKRILDGAKL